MPQTNTQRSVPLTEDELDLLWTKVDAMVQCREDLLDEGEEPGQELVLWRSIRKKLARAGFGG